MTFFGPTFPNETNNEALLNGRQRFGHRSANMFFVRPARHIACPRRLKYIHDIKTGYIPYVEDEPYSNQPNYRHVLQKINDDFMNSKNNLNGIGLYNSADAWRHELMELAQQIKSSLVYHDDQEQNLRSSRCSQKRRTWPKRSSSSISNYAAENKNEKKISKRLLNRRASQHQQRPKEDKSKTKNDKSEQATNEDNQDPGIWLIPILCYILQIDNIFEAQDWLVNANPTEKRLAMELISRTMQDLQTHDNDVLSEISTSDLSTITSQSPTTNLNNIYWPYKIWQRQEKDRQQQQIQNFLKQSKLTDLPSLPLLNIDNGETCERATSPLRMVTPAKHSLATHMPSIYNRVPVETTVIERSPTRNSNERAAPSVVIRQNPNANANPHTDRLVIVDKRSSSRSSTPAVHNGNDRLSRRSIRVTTSLAGSIDDDSKPLTARGKTPLI